MRSCESWKVKVTQTSFLFSAAAARGVVSPESRLSLSPSPDLSPALCRLPPVDSEEGVSVSRNDTVFFLSKILFTLRSKQVDCEKNNRSVCYNRQFVAEFITCMILLPGLRSSVSRFTTAIWRYITISSNCISTDCARVGCFLHGILVTPCVTTCCLFTFAGGRIIAILITVGD